MRALAIRPFAPLPVLALIAAAWALALTAAFTGAGEALHHHRLSHTAGGLPWLAGLLVLLVAWQVHIAAMMLPSSLPLVALFDQASAAQRHPGRVRVAFLSGYAVVWTAFAALAFTFDADLQRAAHRSVWLAERPWLITGSTLIVAGLFQFSKLKDRCLRECRHPSGFLARHYRHGNRAAFTLGLRHGLFCLGCCWALMLVMFAVGIANLAWMAPLTLFMLYEKTRPAGKRVSAVAGVALLALAALILAHPTWLPQWILVA